MIYAGKSGKRAYLLIPKTMNQHDAAEWAKTYWHCRLDEIILGGAKKKRGDEWYVELPFDEGNYWSIHRGCKTDTEYLVKFLRGSNETAKVDMSKIKVEIERR